jgi:hypothetical protein
MKTILFCTMIIFLTSAACVAATPDSSIINQYEKEAIYLHTGFFKYNYIKGGEKKKLGVGLKNLRTEFEKTSPGALAEFKEYKKCNKRAGLWIGATYAFAFGSVALLEATPVGALVTVAGILVPMGFSMNNIIKSENHFQKSIWVHNRDILAKAK